MSKIKVCLDAGHAGKYNRSNVVPAYYESDMNWKLHLKLKAELEKYGIEVITTRANQNTDKELYQRGATSKGCDLFLSLHSNATGSNDKEHVDYVAVYHLTEDNGTNVDDKSKALAALLAPVIAKTMGVKQGYEIMTRKASTDKNNDGVLNDNYYGVLNGARQAGTPGLILEHSFHTNTNATKWLLDDANLDKLAKAEAEVIAGYYGLNKTTVKTETRYRVTIAEPVYANKADAQKALAKLTEAGFTAAIKEETVKVEVPVEPVKPTPATPVAPAKKSIEEVAKEVLNGNWGNGQERKDRLTAAGYNYSEIQSLVNKLASGEAVSAPAKKSITEIAKEVINGDWGNGQDRKNRLTAAGYDYAEVQKKVNELCK